MTDLAPGHADWEPYIRAYLIYVIGSFIAPDASNTLVSVFYLPLLDDLSKVGEYSWGSAALSNFHVGLKRGAGMTGMAYALIVWAMEHIKPLMNEMGVREKPMEFPLIWGWADILRPCFRNTRSQIKFPRFNEILSTLSVEDIEWEPYRRLTGTFGVGYEGRDRAAVCSTVVSCFYFIAYHKPEKAPRQFGFISASDSAYPEFPKDANCKGPKLGRDLRTMLPYSDFIERFTTRTLMEGVLVEQHVEEQHNLQDKVPIPQREDRVEPTDVQFEDPGEHGAEAGSSRSPFHPNSPHLLVYKRRCAQGVHSPVSRMRSSVDAEPESHPHASPIRSSPPLSTTVPIEWSREDVHRPDQKLCGDIFLSINRAKYVALGGPIVSTGYGGDTLFSVYYKLEDLRKEVLVDGYGGIRYFLAHYFHFLNQLCPQQSSASGDIF